ncbi:MAG TPA: hypothetical protein VFD01_17035 [Candidatus Dormibacteraeota bacterium]|nr:hypothetical protein [Candidatus Dormibacteraeota bacterium]
MDTVAFVVLLFLAIVIFINVVRGTLGTWLGAKLLNRTPSS